MKKQNQQNQEYERWKHQFQEQFVCKSNDMKCWYNLLPKLSCDIQDTSCWKQKYPIIPCGQKQSECWRKLLPDLPCKVEDRKCWNGVKTHEQQRRLNNNDQIIINNVYEEKAFNPTRFFERNFSGYQNITKDGDRWIV